MSLQLRYATASLSVVLLVYYFVHIVIYIWLHDCCFYLHIYVFILMYFVPYSVCYVQLTLEHSFTSFMLSVK